MPVYDPFGRDEKGEELQAGPESAAFVCFWGTLTKFQPQNPAVSPTVRGFSPESDIVWSVGPDHLASFGLVWGANFLEVPEIGFQGIPCGLLGYLS